LPQSDSLGGGIPVHVVLYEHTLWTNTYLFVVAKDDANPISIDFIIASDDPSKIDQAAIFDYEGKAIYFSAQLNSRYQYRIRDHQIISVAELPWQQFIGLCKLDSIFFSSEHKNMYIGNNVVGDLNILRDYLAERKPNELPPDDYVDPTVVKRVEPIYPQQALQEGATGDVIVKVWVDEQGKVHEVVVLQTDAEIFNAPAIEAARQWIFTPAKILGKPVSVWVSIPFYFQMRRK